MAELQIGFALHQERRGKEFREKIIAPNGFTIVEGDAANQETRWMAELSGDETMKALCEPGEDMHSYMGARIGHVAYQDLVVRVAEGDKDAKTLRLMGKVGNLACVMSGTRILTDRGYAAIQDVTIADRIWDGSEFVSHTGVVCSGVKKVITYAGLTATPDHRVLVDGVWVEFQEAARHDWVIEPAMGQGWTSQSRSAIRIMDGIIHRLSSKVGRTLCEGAMRLWRRERSDRQFSGDWSLVRLPGVRLSTNAWGSRSSRNRNTDRQAASEARQRDVSEVQQSERPELSQLWRSRDRVSILFDQGWCRVRQDISPASDLLEGGYRTRKQPWSLRTWKCATDYTQGQPAKQKDERFCSLERFAGAFAGMASESVFCHLRRALCGAGSFWRTDHRTRMDVGSGEAQGLATTSRTALVYDVTNCGPRNRFAAAGLIVHNCQYRTSAVKLLSVARVQYDMDMKAAEANKIHSTYRSTYKGVPTYWSSQIEKVKNKGYAETLAGRRVAVVGDWSRFSKERWALESTAINFPVQGVGAEQKYLALACLKNILSEFGAKFFMDLHDGIYVLCPDNKVEKFIIKVKKILDALPYTKAWGYTPSIPLPWDASYGPSWGQLRSWKG